MGWLADRFELSRGDAGNLRSMEGLRGFAVFLVFLAHYTAQIIPYIPADSVLLSAFVEIRDIGRSGVDLFFVLSGFLIYGSLISRASSSYSSFMRRRVQRILSDLSRGPGALRRSLLSDPSGSKNSPGAWPAIRYLLENALLLPGMFPIKPMITQAWSLSYEMFYYLLTPILIAAFSLRSRSVNARIAFFLVLGLALVLWCSAFGGPVRLLGFVAGIVLYEVLQNRLVPAPGTVAGMSCLIAGLGVMLLPISGPAGFSAKILLLSMALFVLCFSCFGRPSSKAAALFSWTPMRWLGNMSYSYYLIHGVTLLGFFWLFAHLWPPAGQSSLLSIALLPVTFALTLVSSAALFLIVERRFSLKPARLHAAVLVPEPRPSLTAAPSR